MDSSLADCGRIHQKLEQIDILVMPEAKTGKPVTLDTKTEPPTLQKRRMPNSFEVHLLMHKCPMKLWMRYSDRCFSPLSSTKANARSTADDRTSTRNQL